MLNKQNMQRYCKQYHKDHYVSNTTTRDTKNKETLGKICTIILYFANKAGKEFKLEMFRDNEVSKLREHGWTEPFAIDQSTIAEVCSISQKSVSRWLAKAEELGYIINIGQYTFDESNYPSNMYIVDEWTISSDYGDDLDKNKSLCDKLITSTKESKSSIAFNNKCMKQKIWQDVKAMIDKANEGRHELTTVKFLKEMDNGNYDGGRYYSPLCSTKRPDHDPDNARINSLNDIFGTTDAKFEEIDVNSMTYRTQYNLVHDQYLSIDADVYYELYKKMTLEPMPYNVFKVKARELIKTNCMSINMEPRSVYCKTHKLAESSNLNKVKEEFLVDEIESVFNMTYEEFLNRLKESMYQLLSVYDFEGDKRVFLGRMFFKYEAIVYYYMHEEFAKLNIMTANVYDGWYFLEGTCDKETFYKVYHKAIDLTKKFLADHNHDLVKIYGKTYTLKYKLYKKVEPKSYPKTERQKGTYDVVSTKKVEHVDAETHNQSRNDYVEKIKQRALELEAQGKKAVY